ncbi:MAG: NAD(P)/FAD-dependent oxidoreductase [Clostridia bacterium]|nr:NAD(P)/FAD-dependent oxidoreductase [Clostridia bacterium]
MASQVVVIGGGPAGMIAAGMAAVRGKDVILFEKNKSLGKKLLLTGKGRCNITNVGCDLQGFVENIPVNGSFMYSALKTFGSAQLIEFFNNLGLYFIEEHGGRAFPQSQKAADVLEKLEFFLKKSRVRVINGDVDQVVIENGAVKGVYLSNDLYYPAKSVVVATGGLSYPQTGSTGDGYWFAEFAGHHIVPPVPALIPLESPDKVCRELQGLSLKNVGFKVYDKNEKLVYEDFGEMLFTHFGISGPIVLSASTHLRDYEENGYTVSIDLKSALDMDTLEKRLQSEFDAAAKQNFSNSLGKLFPGKLTSVMVKRSGIQPEKKCSDITKDERAAFARLIKDFRVPISGTRPIEEAIITSGGVDTKEINPSTMESKLVKGLYFAGEVIDVSGYTGGFNLQIAFSTGYMAGDNVK